MRSFMMAVRIRFSLNPKKNLSRGICGLPHVSRWRASESGCAWLEKAYQAHDNRIELLSMYYDNFRSDPRYDDLMRRVGFPL